MQHSKLTCKRKYAKNLLLVDRERFYLILVENVLNLNSKNLII